MEELLFSGTLDGEALVKDILNTDGVSSITARRENHIGGIQ